MLAASAAEFKQVLQEGEQFVLASTVGQEEGEVGGKVSGLDDHVFGELFSFEGVPGQIIEGPGWLQFHYLNIDYALYI